MFKDTPAFSGYSVDDAAAATLFYRDTLGIDVSPVKGMEAYGMIELHVAGSRPIFLYEKPDHAPATFTVLSFPVADIDKAVDDLTEKGVEIIHYHSDDIPQDEKGIVRGLSQNRGPDIAWFTDPAGNSLAVLQDS